MKKILALSEIMLRRSNPEYKRCDRSVSFDICIGSGDASGDSHSKHVSYDEGHWFKKKIEVRL